MSETLARRQMREQDTRINILIDSQIRTEERIDTQKGRKT